PKDKREKLLQAYAAGLGRVGEDVKKTDPVEARYPLITWAAAHASGIQPIETTPENSRTLHLQWLDGSVDGKEFEIGRILREQLVKGGCAAVICNTVDRAQEVYSRLKKLFPGIASDGRDCVDLLHARFLFNGRAERELRTLIRYGKDGEEIADDSGRKHK